MLLNVITRFNNYELDMKLTVQQKKKLFKTSMYFCGRLTTEFRLKQVQWEWQWGGKRDVCGKCGCV